MSQPHMDENDLARFLDRGMSREEHGRAIAHLSASDEDAEVLADAAFMLRELEAEDGVPAGDTDAPADAGVPADNSAPADAEAADAGARVIPLRPPSTLRVRRRIPAQWMALAAVLAGVLLVMPSALSRLRNPYSGDPAQLATHLEGGLPADWRLGWSGTRGSGEVGVDEVRAVRLGALLLDLQIAVDGRQKEQTQTVAGRIRVMLADVTAGSALAEPYDQVAAGAGAPPAQLAGLLQEGYDNLAVAVDEDYLAAGTWLEAARIALEKRDAGFFHSRVTQGALDRIGALTMPAEAHVAVDAIRTASRGEPAPDWEALASALGALGRELWG